MRHTPQGPSSARRAIPYRYFITAHAGNTSGPNGSAAMAPVHPRACGEHYWEKALRPPQSGSSPRMRGTRPARQAWFFPYRFIPAHAGNTGDSFPPRRPLPVHPRACGEHTGSTTPATLADGSSPRMRGTPLFNGLALASDRFIPAHAGNTRGFRRMKSSRSVHPRACGEDASAKRYAFASGGSSPRMRGRRDRDGKLGNRQRFIPAHAGKTRSN